MKNRLLRELPQEDFQRVTESLEPVDLPSGFIMVGAEQPIEYAYFLNSGIGSIVASTANGQRAEAGLFGREGYAPTALAMGSDTNPHDIFIQLAGDGFRIGSGDLLRLIETVPALRKLLFLYHQTLLTQTAFTALSNAVHQVDRRCARWLLMCHDRVGGDEISLTHEFLSLMLAVRRPSVTTALHVLEGNRLIRAERGYVTIRDRKGLETFAADAYGRPEEEYHRLIGSF